MLSLNNRNKITGEEKKSDLTLKLAHAKAHNVQMAVFSDNFLV